MHLKNFLIIILLIAIPLLLLVLCYRNYAYNYCKNDMKCLEDKLTFNLSNLNNKLKSLHNSMKEEEKNELSYNSNNNEQIEGFFSGLGNWFSGSAPTNLPVTPGSLPTEDLMTLEKKINAKNPSINTELSTFPPKDINGNSDDFQDSDNAELLGHVAKTSQPTKMKGKPYGGVNKATVDTPVDKGVIENPPVKSESVPSISKSLESKPAPVSNNISLKTILNKCGFYNGSCPDNYFELGSFGLHGVSSNSILTCGNVQDTKPAKAIAHIKNNTVHEIHILDQGHGFNPESPPKINIEGGNGHGATAEAIIDDDGFLKTIKIINPGYNYTETPNILIDAPMMNSSCHLCCKDE